MMTPRSSPKTQSGEHLGLRSDALGLIESVIMGVAGSAPAYSCAASVSALIGVAGVVAPAAILYCGALVFGIAVAYRHLNLSDANAGATYAWVGKTIHPALGFLSGWSGLVAAVVFMVTGTLPAATITLNLIAPTLAANQFATTAAAGGWLFVIGGVVAKGVKPTSYAQIIFTATEACILVLLVALAVAQHGRTPAHIPGAAWFTGGGLTLRTFVDSSLIGLFALSGWDVSTNLNEETRNGARLAGKGSLIALAIVIALFAGFVVIALVVLDDAEIAGAGLDIVARVAGKLLPQPWSSLAAAAVMLSTIGTLETSIIQFTRTLFSMGRDGVLPATYGRLHPIWRTPVHATLLIMGLGLSLLLLTLLLPGIKTVIQDTIEVVGLQTAVSYGLAGLACVWRFRAQAATSVARFGLYMAWPAIGAGFCFLLTILSFLSFDVTTDVIGLGGIAIGILPYALSRPRRITRSGA